MGKPQRYIVKSEQRPPNTPTGWRAMYEVIDIGTSLVNGTVMRRFWSWSDADRHARMLNDVQRHAVAVGAR